jgi:Ca2+-binding RTX toxin-like protein
MATTTTTLDISADNTNYNQTAVTDPAGTNDYYTELATISGANDSVTLNSNNQEQVVNDVILVTGSNDLVSDNGYAGVIDAHTTTSTNGLVITGADNTILGGLGNDAITSHGEILSFSPTSTQTVSGASHTITGANVFEVGNFLYGEAGNDTINFSSADTVYGGAGNDVLTLTTDITPTLGATNATLGAFISGDAGNDTISISASAGYNTVYGGDGDDTLYGNSTHGFDSIYGQAGNDTILVTTGSNDVVYGGAGNDAVSLGASAGGYQFISGDLGNDTIDLHSATTGVNDTVYGGAGDDTIYGSGSTGNQLYGQTGNDTITLVGQGSVYGGQGNDLITDGTAHANNSFFSGDLGDDSIFAYGANDTLYGGDGNDSLLAHGGNDQLYGQSGNDILIFDALSTSSLNATIYGGQGDDLISVTFATVAGTIVTQTLDSGGTSALYDPYTGGSIGVNDVVSYTPTTVADGNGFHFLSGDIGNDTIYGGSGGDTFVGGAGTDQLYSHRLTATGNDPSAPGYAANGAGTPSVSDAGSAVNPENTDTTPGATHTVYSGGTAPAYATPSQHIAAPSASDLADTFVFSTGDSVGTSPTSPGTGSDISSGAGEAGLDHIHGFLLNVTGQEATYANTTSATEHPFINSQEGDNLVFLSGTETIGNYTPTLDTNVFYGTVNNVLAGTTTATEQSDYAVAYSYAFGTGGTASAPTASAHFANSVDYIVVDVYDTTSSTDGPGVTTHNTGTNNGNIFVFDHNGNAVALDGAGLASAGTTGAFQNSASPSGGLVDGTDALSQPLSVTTVNIYH